MTTTTLTRRCPRCKTGNVFPDGDGDHTCLQCGWRRPPAVVLDIPVSMDGRQPQAQQRHSFLARAPLVAYIASHPGVTVNDLCDAFSANRKTMQGRVMRAEDAGAIRHEGTGNPKDPFRFYAVEEAKSA